MAAVGVEGEAPRRSGRPRSEQTTQAVLDATRQLLLEDGYGRLSIERIATTAGVGTTAIYRRWSTKALLVADALGDASELPEVDTGDIARDLRTLLAAGWAGPRHDRSIALRVLSEAHGDPELSEAIRCRTINPRREALTAVLRRGVASGIIRADADLDLAVDVLVGPLVKRMLLDSSPVPATLPGRLVDLVLRGLHA
jgi:AcrR family transcriptional regulator